MFDLSLFLPSVGLGLMLGLVCGAAPFVFHARTRFMILSATLGACRRELMKYALWKRDTLAAVEPEARPVPLGQFQKDQKTGEMLADLETTVNRLHVSLEEEAALVSAHRHDMRAVTGKIKVLRAHVGGQAFSTGVKKTPRIPEFVPATIGLRPSQIQRKHERGFVAVFALFMLMILSVLMFAFMRLATSEPVIATNQMHTAQARAAAESGIEQAIWSLNNSQPVPSGTVSMPTGESFTVTTSPGSQVNQVLVDAHGFASNAQQHITATLWRNPWISTPLLSPVHTTDGQVAGGSSVDSRTSQCGLRDGVWYTNSFEVGGPNAQVNTTPRPVASFDQIKFTAVDLGVLRAIAKVQGTYFSGSTVQNLIFNVGNPLPDHGVVFVDSLTGQVGGPSQDDAQVTVGAVANAAIFKGILVVLGSLTVQNIPVQGILYATSDLNLFATQGNASVVGAMVGHTSITVDTNAGGQVHVTHDCAQIDTLGQTVNGWMLQPATYQEVSG